MWPRWIELRGCVLREEVANPDAVADWLDKTFPDRAFSVEVATPDEDYGPTVYVVTAPAP